jgi:hypothetical protein
MKLKIITILALFIVLLGLVGIAAAYDCPGPEEWDKVNTPGLEYFYTIDATGANPVTYEAGGFATNQIREVCVASTLSNALSGTVSWDLWASSDITIKPANPQWPRAWAQFKDGGEPNDIPADGTMHEFGTVTWNFEPGNTQLFLLHVKDSRCVGGDTCYVIPKGPNPPVPELSTGILMSAGLIGLIGLTRYRRKE